MLIKSQAPIRDRWGASRDVGGCKIGRHDETGRRRRVFLSPLLLLDSHAESFTNSGRLNAPKTHLLDPLLGVLFGSFGVVRFITQAKWKHVQAKYRSDLSTSNKWQTTQSIMSVTASGSGNGRQLRVPVSGRTWFISVIGKYTSLFRETGTIVTVE